MEKSYARERLNESYFDNITDDDIKNDSSDSFEHYDEHKFRFTLNAMKDYQNSWLILGKKDYSGLGMSNEDVDYCLGRLRGDFKKWKRCVSNLDFVSNYKLYVDRYSRADFNLMKVENRWTWEEFENGGFMDLVKSLFSTGHVYCLSWTMEFNVEPDYDFKPFIRDMGNYWRNYMQWGWNTHHTVFRDSLSDEVILHEAQVWRNLPVDKMIRLYEKLWDQSDERDPEERYEMEDYVYTQKLGYRNCSRFVQYLIWCDENRTELDKKYDVEIEGFNKSESSVDGNRLDLYLNISKKRLDHNDSVYEWNRECDFDEIVNLVLDVFGEKVAFFAKRYDEFRGFDIYFEIRTQGKMEVESKMKRNPMRIAIDAEVDQKFFIAVYEGVYLVDIGRKLVHRRPAPYQDYSKSGWARIKAHDIAI